MTDEQAGRLEERLSSIADKLDNMDEKLFGNGQPGILKELELRIRWLEFKYWFIAGGAIVVIGFAKWLVK